MLKVVQDDSSANAASGSASSASSLLDEIVRDGARQMLAAALRAEVAAYIEAHRDEVDDLGRRLVVRNGFHAQRPVSGCGSPPRSCRPGREVPAGGRGVAAAVPARPFQR